jgi:hypothetical protein
MYGCHTHHFPHQAQRTRLHTPTLKVKMQNGSTIKAPLGRKNLPCLAPSCKIAAPTQWHLLAVGGCFHRSHVNALKMARAGQDVHLLVWPYWQQTRRKRPSWESAMCHGPLVMDSAISFGKFMVILTRSGNAIWLMRVNRRMQKGHKKAT